MASRRVDLVAMAGLALAAVVIGSPLLLHLNGVPPEDVDLGIDILDETSKVGAARQTILRFRQFPLRSPWHGGGYPIYAYPDDSTFTPAMLFILATNEWAGFKIDYVLTMIVGAVGMYLLTRRQQGFTLVGALFSASAFAFGGFLMARWLRGFRVSTHAVWLPLMLYALWRGKERRAWLGLAAVLVAWLFLDHKYVPIAMGWFLLMVGLVRLDEPATSEVRPAWGYFGRLVLVWAFGLALAALKLVPMAPLLAQHLVARGMVPQPARFGTAALVWAAVFAALGLTPLIAAWLGRAGTRRRGALLAAAVVAGVFAAVIRWAPGRHPDASLHWVRTHGIDGFLSFGTWRVHASGVLSPTASDRYRGCAPVGPVVAVLALVALVASPRQTWRWGLLLFIFLLLELGAALPRDLGGAASQLPFLSWVRRPREQFNFFAFFLFCLLAGRAFDLLRRPVWWVQVPASLVLLAHVVYLGSEVMPRLRYTTTERVPEGPWNEPYELLDGPWRDEHVLGTRWPYHTAFLVRRNVGTQFWHIDFVESRHLGLIPSLRIEPDFTVSVNRAYPGLAFFQDAANRVTKIHFTPNVIVVRVRVTRPGILMVNQMRDRDWRSNRGRIVHGAPRLAVALDEVGEYDVRLDYVPVLFYQGAAVSGTALVLGVALLVIARRRRLASERGHRLSAPRRAGHPPPRRGP